MTTGLVTTDGCTADPGGDMMALIRTLYPICRSITGDGVRETLAVLGQSIPVEVYEVPSGTPVLDWEVPDEWSIRDAYVATSSGERVIDFQSSNLHVVSYSVPVHATMSLSELRPHLHTLPEQPDLIPYRTSYYAPNWGFCLSQAQLDALADDQYEVCIDSTLEPGSLTYGEVVVPGETDREFLVSAHVCHPSLCDDNLSGIAVAAEVAQRLLDGQTPRHTVRFVFAPGTIGAITWLARHRDVVERIDHGLTLTCLGDSHPFTYKRTFDGDAAIDRYAEDVLASSGPENRVIDYFPYGYDERQYNSPGFRLPVGSLMRGRHGTFPEYHTSGDDLAFVSADRLAESANLLEAIVAMADHDRHLVNLAPYGEPQLGRRGLYGSRGGTNVPDAQLAMLWILGSADGTMSLHDIARRSGIEFDQLVIVARTLEENGLLREWECERWATDAHEETGGSE